MLFDDELTNTTLLADEEDEETDDGEEHDLDEIDDAFEEVEETEEVEADAILPPLEDTASDIPAPYDPEADPPDFERMDE